MPSSLRGLSATRRAELYGKLSTKAVFKRFLRRTATGKLRIDKAAVLREAHLDGKFLLRTDDESLSAEDIALGDKSLYEAEYWFTRQFLPALEAFPHLDPLVSPSPAA